MKYIGIATQQRNNNIRSLFLLLCFPALVLALLYMACFAFGLAGYNNGNILFLQALAVIFVFGMVSVGIVYAFVAIFNKPSLLTVIIILSVIVFFAFSGTFSILSIFSPLLTLFWQVFTSILPRVALVTVIWFVFAYYANIHIITLAICLALSYIACFVLMFVNSNHIVHAFANDLFLSLLPYVVGITLVWFIVAYFANVAIIAQITGAFALERRENKRVYNLVENLCISCGMAMPKINIIEDNALNAFASGINAASYTVTLTCGIIDALDDKELEGVIAHELTHIRNNDVRVMVIAIVFTGIFDMLVEWILRIGNLMDKEKPFATIMMPVVLAPFTMGYGISTLMRFAISRNREYMADAGAVELTKDSKALANALRKIADNSELRLDLENVAGLFIEHKPPQTGFKRIFAALYEPHPPIYERIQILSGF